MKTLFSLSLAALALTGCTKEAGNPAPQTNATSNSTPSEGSVLTAPVDYLNTITKQQQHAVKTVDVAAVSKAIQLFQVEQGRYPKDLEELVQQKFLPQVPQTPHGTRLDYDANAGTVKVVKGQ